MQRETQREEIYDDFGEPQSFWSRMRDRMFGPEDELDEEPESQLPSAGRPAIRLHSSRTVHVDIRKSPCSLEDARSSADGLKSGKQQLVNLEKTPPQTADRLVDFLSGVTYALDGTVERIGERVYLFAPANVEIEVDAPGEGAPESNAAWGA
jgi:cell division inhibitor SepF